MRRARRVALALVATGAFGTTLSPVARADTPPSVWDQAKDPSARERWELHVTVNELMEVGRHLLVGRLGAGSFERARGLLEEADAAHSSDVRLRFDLGEVYEALFHHDRAIDVLAPALALAPDHPAATEAWITLAYAYAHVDKTREEELAYEKYLERSIDTRSRATVLLNLAEAEMRLGHMDEAVAGYRDAIATAASVPNSLGAAESGVLAVWGLAVALDRSGDSAGAAAEAHLATQMDPHEAIISNEDHVFFVPSYERLWYLALGATEHAKQASDPRKAARLWRYVEQLWSSYVAHADAHERWGALANAHLSRARGERAAAEKRAAKSSAPPSTDEEPMFFRPSF